MDYQDTLKYLYESVPMFQQVGGAAYKPGLGTTEKLDEHLGHPHQNYRTIHVAGTNGKGSCSHTLAAVLQAAGYRVGLYTSPHLLDFRERIRVNGEPIPEQDVVDFVEKQRSFFEPLHPSFFELATAMAFRYFADAKIDVAVVEVGMGGRLDCTNIIHPDLCIITNIGLDHTQYLGNTLEQIASEKAGIIKPGVPVVIGRATGGVKRVFIEKAKEMEAPITFADERKDRYRIDWTEHAMRIGKKDSDQYFTFELNGACQEENGVTILTALEKLQALGYRITNGDIAMGMANVCQLTGLMGRWQRISTSPDLICDTGHNVDGFQWTVKRLKQIMDANRKLHIVFGMVKDKDVRGILQLLPKNATYYITHASVERAMPADELFHLAKEEGLVHSQVYPTVAEAVQAAKKNCLPTDVIFVGGSTFIVADLLASCDALNLH